MVAGRRWAVEVWLMVIFLGRRAAGLVALSKREPVPPSKPLFCKDDNGLAPRPQAPAPAKPHGMADGGGMRFPIPSPGGSFQARQPCPCQHWLFHIAARLPQKGLLNQRGGPRYRLPPASAIPASSQVLAAGFLDGVAAVPTPSSRDPANPAAVLAGLLALGAVAVWSVTRPLASLEPAAAVKPAEAPLPLVVSTPPVSLPQPIFDAENTMTLPDRLARWDRLIDEAARRFKVPREWIVAVMRQESGGRTVLQNDVPITSVAGAMGLMQVMPDTYRDMRLENRLGQNAYDPRDNVMAGTAYIKFLHGKYGYPALFAAYNDGPGNLEANLAGKRDLPAETIAYLTNIRIRLGDAPKAGEVGLARGGVLSVTVNLTRPDGQSVAVDGGAVKGVRAVLPGEYPPTAAAVIDLGKTRQAVREDVASATQLLKAAGAKL
jgi:hypothetical protein